MINNTNIPDDKDRQELHRLWLTVGRHSVSEDIFNKAVTAHITRSIALAEIEARIDVINHLRPTRAAELSYPGDVLLDIIGHMDTDLKDLNSQKQKLMSGQSDEVA